jgi:hypothetical protein
VQFFFSIEWRLDRASPFLRVYARAASAIAGRPWRSDKVRDSPAPQHGTPCCLLAPVAVAVRPPTDRRSRRGQRRIGACFHPLVTGIAQMRDRRPVVRAMAADQARRSIWAIDDISLAITDAVGQQDVASRSIGRTSTMRPDLSGR